MIRNLNGKHWQCKEWLLKEPTQLSRQIASPYLYKLGDMKCSKGFANQQISSTFAIHFITSGSGFFKTNHKFYQTNKGDIFFFFPQQFYQYSINKRAHWNFTWINMQGDDLAPILSQLNINAKNPYIKNTNLELIKTILDATKKSFSFTHTLQSTSIQLAWALIECIERLHSTTDEHLDLAEQVKWLIDNDTNNNLTIQEIADQLEYTRATILRLFKKKYNTSPKDYMDTTRIEKASKMLLTTTCSIKEISASLGFSNPNYFARTFKKHKSLNPKEFRSR